MTDKVKGLQGKRLLIMGGGAEMVNVTRLAQELGCRVYVTDYYDTLRSPAKLLADESAQISIADTDALVDYIREKKIDGVLTGFTDSYLEHYLRVCKEAGLPHYGSEKAFEIATDKMLFKKACQESGIGVIPGTNAYDFETVLEFAKHNGYPLMIKPTDNSGSRGVIKCESVEDLKQCYEYALSFSPSQNVIVERFMDCESVGIVYQLSGEEIKLVALCDRKIYQAEADGSSIVSGTLYPSKYLSRYIDEVDECMCNMLRSNGFRDGMVSPMAFVNDEGFFMCEMCYRPSGGHHYTLINDQNRVNGLALLIEFAVTGDTKSYDSLKEDPAFRDCCGMIHILGDPGKIIAEVSGIEQINELSYVLEVCQNLRVGMTIGKDGTTAQTLISVWLKASSWEEYQLRVTEIKSILKVLDGDGNSLVKF